MKKLILFMIFLPLLFSCSDRLPDTSVIIEPIGGNFLALRPTYLSQLTFRPVIFLKSRDENGSSFYWIDANGKVIDVNYLNSRNLHTNMQYVILDTVSGIDILLNKSALAVKAYLDPNTAQIISKTSTKEYLKSSCWYKSRVTVKYSLLRYDPSKRVFIQYIKPVGITIAWPVPLGLILLMLIVNVFFATKKFVQKNIINIGLVIGMICGGMIFLIFYIYPDSGPTSIVEPVFMSLILWFFFSALFITGSEAIKISKKHKELNQILLMFISGIFGYLVLRIDSKLPLIEAWVPILIISSPALITAYRFHKAQKLIKKRRRASR